MNLTPEGPDKYIKTDEINSFHNRVLYILHSIWGIYKIFLAKMCKLQLGWSVGSKSNICLIIIPSRGGQVTVFQVGWSCASFLFEDNCLVPEKGGNQNEIPDSRAQATEIGLGKVLKMVKG